MSKGTRGKGKRERGKAHENDKDGTDPQSEFSNRRGSTRVFLLGEFRLESFSRHGGETFGRGGQGMRFRRREAIG